MIKTRQLCRRYKEENVELLSYNLSSESWLEVYLAPVSVKYDLFDYIFMHYVNISCPKMWVTKTESRKSYWITHEIKKKKRIFRALSRQ